MEYTVFPDPANLAAHAADMIEAEVANYGGIVLGLAGGSTPKATYTSLADRTIDWSRSTAWMTDERWVMPDHDDANQNMVRQSFVDPTGVGFLVPDTRIESPTEAAADFTRKIVPVAASGRRSIVLLGIGADGHTASLFPGTSALNEQGVAYVDTYVPKLGVHRLTATFGLIAEADVVLFLVAGAGKASMVASIAEGATVPAARVTARERVHWLLDEAAAADL